MNTLQPEHILASLGIQSKNDGTAIGQKWSASSHYIGSSSPIQNQHLAEVNTTTESDYHKVVGAAHQAFVDWRKIPAPKRGEYIRQFGNALREKKETLGALVSLEMGKSYQEGLGEVQEMIDICDFAVGLSRQLYRSMNGYEWQFVER